MSVNWFRYSDTLVEFESLLLSPHSVIGDVGCGSGFLSIEIGSNHDVYAIDKDIQDKEELIHHKIPIFECDIEVDNLPFDDNFFDCVLLLEVIEHIDPRRIRFALGEIHRTLKPNGILLLTTPNQSSIQNVVRLFLGKRILFSTDHVREYVLEEILEELSRSKFSVFVKKYLLSYDKTTYSGEDISPHVHVLSGWLKHRNITNVMRVLLYPVKMLVPRFRSLILVVARKVGT